MDSWLHLDLCMGFACDAEYVANVVQLNLTMNHVIAKWISADQTFTEHLKAAVKHVLMLSYNLYVCVCVCAFNSGFVDLVVWQNDLRQCWIEMSSFHLNPQPLT